MDSGYDLKNFIPIDYQNTSKNKKNIANERAIMLLILINVTIFPINISILINKRHEPQNDIPTIMSKVDNSVSDEIKKWIDLKSIGIESLKAENGVGEVIITNKDKAYTMEEEGFQILMIESQEDKYKALVKSGGVR